MIATVIRNGPRGNRGYLSFSLVEKKAYFSDSYLLLFLLSRKTRVILGQQLAVQEITRDFLALAVQSQQIPITRELFFQKVGDILLKRKSSKLLHLQN